MVGSDLIDMFTKFKVTTYVGLEDFVDKLNFLFTCSFLMLCCTVVTVKTYIMSPLSCYIATPVSGSGNMDYVSAWCWAEGTYAMDVRDMDGLNVHNLPNIAHQKIHYYQWVPFVLGLQCCLFYMPRVVWQFFSHNCAGTDLEYIISLSNDAVHSDPEKSKKLVDYITKSLEGVFYQHREYRTSGVTVLKRQLHRAFTFLLPSKRLGTKLVNFYIVVKVLYALNSISQLYLMHSFLRMPGQYPFFGYDLLRNLSRGLDWQNTRIFPRIGGCGMLLKIAGATHWQIAQCALPVNMLNEKLYIFLWFWIFGLSVLNCLSILRWTIRIAMVKRQYKFVKKFLRLNGVFKRESGDCIGLKKAIRQFCKAFLRQDGIFTLKMISINTGDVICSKIINRLWETYKKKYIEHDFRNDADFEHIRDLPAAAAAELALVGGGGPKDPGASPLKLPASLTPIGFVDDGNRPLLHSGSPSPQPSKPPSLPQRYPMVNGNKPGNFRSPNVYAEEMRK